MIIRSINNDDQWLPCSDGKLIAVSARVRAQSAEQDRRTFIAKASAVGASLMGVGLGYTLFHRSAKSGSGRLVMACSQVQLELAAFIEGSIDDQTKAQIDRHLEYCYKCRDKLVMIRNSIAPSGGACRGPR